MSAHFGAQALFIVFMLGILTGVILLACGKLWFQRLLLSFSDYFRTRNHNQRCPWLNRQH
jgi:hypothetical protein